MLYMIDALYLPVQYRHTLVVLGSNHTLIVIGPTRLQELPRGKELKPNS